ncbi:hypothetical protein [Bdellovibrio sp. HCB-162]|uniref:hypothetical protein n=1 Tax=Bdellovibrio sp. HCB-162 TaxID=3394234 RepID=UPI0039BCB2F4
MKFKNILSVLFSLVSFSLAYGQSLSTLRMNKSQFVEGERAVLLASLNSSPQNADEEYFMLGSLNTNQLKLTRISDTEAASVTVPLALGTYSWEVKTYKQSKSLAKQIEADLLMAEVDIQKVSRLLSSETDPNKISDLTTALQNLNDRKVNLKTQLSQGRTLIEAKSISFQVVSQYKRLHRTTNALTLSTNMTNDTFVSGEQGTLSVAIDEGNLGGSGLEAEISATLGGTSVWPVKVSEWLYQSEINSAQLGAGSHAYVATLYTRDKASASSIRDAIVKGGNRKVQTEILKNSTLNSRLILYYEKEIADLVMILDSFYGVLDQLKTLVETKSLTLTVVNPPPVSISVTNLEVEEGVATPKSYSIKLNNEPTGDVTVVVSSALSDVVLSADPVLKRKPKRAPLTLTFTTQNWTTPQNVYVEVPDNSVVDGERYTTITHMVSGGGYDNVSVPNVALKITDPIVQKNVICAPGFVSMYSYETASYQVVLSHQPSEDTVISIGTGWNGTHFVLNGGWPGGGTALTFTTYDWNVPQTVYISTDDYMDPDWYFFDHSVYGDTSFIPCSVTVYLSM